MKKLFFILGLILSCSIYCFASDGNLKIEIKLKYPQDIASIHLSIGLNNSTSFQFQGELIKEISMSEQIKSLKTEYKKLKTDSEKQQFKSSAYSQLFDSMMVTIFAQNQNINSFIDGKIYFNNKIVSQDNSTLDYGAINLNADISKYIIELLDK